MTPYQTCQTHSEPVFRKIKRWTSKKYCLLCRNNFSQCTSKWRQCVSLFEDAIKRSVSSTTKYQGKNGNNNQQNSLNRSASSIDITKENTITKTEQQVQTNTEDSTCSHETLIAELETEILSLRNDKENILKSQRDLQAENEAFKYESRPKKLPDDYKIQTLPPLNLAPSQKFISEPSIEEVIKLKKELAETLENTKNNEALLVSVRKENNELSGIVSKLQVELQSVNEIFNRTKTELAETKEELNARDLKIQIMEESAEILAAEYKDKGLIATEHIERLQSENKALEARLKSLESSETAAEGENRCQELRAKLQQAKESLEKAMTENEKLKATSVTKVTEITGLMKEKDELLKSVIALKRQIQALNAEKTSLQKQNKELSDETLGLNEELASEKKMKEELQIKLRNAETEKARLIKDKDELAKLMDTVNSGKDSAQEISSRLAEEHAVLRAEIEEKDERIKGLEQIKEILVEEYEAEVKRQKEELMLCKEKLEVETKNNESEALRLEGEKKELEKAIADLKSQLEMTIAEKDSMKTALDKLKEYTADATTQLKNEFATKEKESEQEKHALLSQRAAELASVNEKCEQLKQANQELTLNALKSEKTKQTLELEDKIAALTKEKEELKEIIKAKSQAAQINANKLTKEYTEEATRLRGELAGKEQKMKELLVAGQKLSENLAERLKTIEDLKSVNQALKMECTKEKKDHNIERSELTNTINALKGQLEALGSNKYSVLKERTGESKSKETFTVQHQADISMISNKSKKLQELTSELSQAEHTNATLKENLAKLQAQLEEKTNLLAVYEKSFTNELAKVKEEAEKLRKEKEALAKNADVFTEKYTNLAIQLQNTLAAKRELEVKLLALEKKRQLALLLLILTYIAKQSFKKY
eukprot:TRINITY_DN3000_c2_g1_i1.p1 TRINITY_DN3000_c2_g1~~TRINITY_DN3000_c2_g1_i1.p1  ORF type:complete len:890 (+),score=185.63 TRINITY_DN3000_c2_g1_i1:1798-4467(+)